MKNLRLITGFSVLALAGLGILNGCTENSAIDDPDNSSAVLNVSAIDPQQLDVSLLADSAETASVTITSVLRSGGGGAEAVGVIEALAALDDVTIDTYTVVYTPALPDAGGAISSLTYATNVTVPADGSTSLTATIVPQNLKATLGAATNGVFTVTIVVSGSDLNGKGASAEGAFTLTINP